MSLLSIKDLEINFQGRNHLTKAVKKISFDIPEGKTVGLVGESGSGKSVTAMSVMRLLPEPPAIIAGGEIHFEGQNLLALNDSEMRKIRGNDISMIFQEPMTSLNPVFTVGYQVAEVLMLHQGLNPKEAWEKTIHLFDQVGIPDPSRRVKSYPHEMSGGQKQRVMIAMAIACNPKLLIADEPTTALDVTIQKQVLELMAKLQEEYKMSMLFITHDLGVIADIADETVVMFRGDIVEKGQTKELFKSAQHPYTRGLLSCRPTMDLTARRLPTVNDFLEKKDITALMGQKEIKDFSKEETVLKIDNLKKHYPIKGGFWGGVKDWVKAVDGVSFEVKKGQTLGLVGESGCGKTTLGRTILRLFEPTDGDIFYKGENVRNLSTGDMRKMRKKMQVIFQDPYASLNPRMTVGSAIVEPMKIHNIGADFAARKKRAVELLEKVGLEASHFDRYPHEFSGGQRQRVCIARALAVEPEFIICDESVSALDVSVQAQVLNLLLDLQDEFGLTYIFISHDLAVVNFISDEVAVMNNGHIVEMNTAQEIYKNPKDDYTKKLLSAVPKGLPVEWV